MKLYKSTHIGGFFHNGIVIPVNYHFLNSDSILYFLNQGAPKEMIEEIVKFKRELESDQGFGYNLNGQNQAQQPDRTSIEASTIKNFTPGSIIVRQTKARTRSTISEDEDECQKIFFVKYPIYSGKEVFGDYSDIYTQETFFNNLFIKVKENNVTHLCFPQSTGNVCCYPRRIFSQCLINILDQTFTSWNKELYHNQNEIESLSKTHECGDHIFEFKGPILPKMNPLNQFSLFLLANESSSLRIQSQVVTEYLKKKYRQEEKLNQRLDSTLRETENFLTQPINLEENQNPTRQFHMPKENSEEVFDNLFGKDTFNETQQNSNFNQRSEENFNQYEILSRNKNTSGATQNQFDFAMNEVKVEKDIADNDLIELKHYENKVSDAKNDSDDEKGGNPYYMAYRQTHHDDDNRKEYDLEQNNDSGDVVRDDDSGDVVRDDDTGHGKEGIFNNLHLETTFPDKKAKDSIKKRNTLDTPGFNLEEANEQNISQESLSENYFSESSQKLSNEKKDLNKSDDQIEMTSPR